MGPAGISSLQSPVSNSLSPLFIGKKIGIWDINYQ